MNFYIQVHKEPAHMVTDIKVLIHVRQGNHQRFQREMNALPVEDQNMSASTEGRGEWCLHILTLGLHIAKWSFWGYHSLHVMNNKRGPPLTLLLSQFKDDDSFVLVQSCQKGGYLFQYQLHLWCFNPNFSAFHSRLFMSMSAVRQS